MPDGITPLFHGVAKTEIFRAIVTTEGMPVNRAAIGGLLIGLAPASIIKVGLGLLLIWSAWKISAHPPRNASHN